MDVTHNMAVVRPEAKRSSVVEERGRDFIEKRSEALLAGPHPGAGLIPEEFVRERAAPRNDSGGGRIDIDKPASRKGISIDKRSECRSIAMC
jgi:hypothetical protein